jgi:hypothetical protein
LVVWFDPIALCRFSNGSAPPPKAASCHEAQGFSLARPVAAHQLARFIASDESLALSACAGCQGRLNPANLGQFGPVGGLAQGVGSIDAKTS